MAGNGGRGGGDDAGIWKTGTGYKTGTGINFTGVVVGASGITCTLSSSLVKFSTWGGSLFFSCDKVGENS